MKVAVFAVFILAHFLLGSEGEARAVLRKVESYQADFASSARQAEDCPTLVRKSTQCGCYIAGLFPMPILLGRALDSACQEVLSSVGSTAGDCSPYVLDGAFDPSAFGNDLFGILQVCENSVVDMITSVLGGLVVEITATATSEPEPTPLP